MKDVQIPFESDLPKGQDAESLKKLGFDLSEITKKGAYYFLTLPDTPRIRCEKRSPDFTKVNYTIYYNDIEVIHIYQKTGLYKPCVSIVIYHEAIVRALAKNSSTTAANQEPGVPKGWRRYTDEDWSRHIKSLREAELFEQAAILEANDDDERRAVYSQYRGM